MHDIKIIRENPAAFDAAIARRGLSPLAESLIALDAKRRAAQAEFDATQGKRNTLSKEIGAAKAKKDEARANALMAEVGELKDRLSALEAEQKQHEVALADALSLIPNLPAADVPDGLDENANQELRRHGTPRAFAFKPKEHFDLGEGLGLMDFEAGIKLAGARFTVMRGQLARLSRALGQFMLDLHTTEFGYSETIVPLLVNDDTAFGTGQLPKFGDDLFRTTTGYWMIPTAEVPLTNLARDVIIDESQLPWRLTALTPCFRSEAGAAGRDTRGMIRQHQFEKVELVSITRPEDSEAEHERMTAAAETVLKRLDLPFRTMLLCAGDMGGAARKTYDIEVWLPGQDRYREISSCSNCGDWQARRMNARCRVPGEKGTRFVHTLNGSGLAVGRTLIAVLENYQQEDGSIAVPDALLPYTGGLKKIEKAA
ncbi:serine--tRNA ligase [Ferrovibrio sp.]|uniref:serine--tRNA ligase n=1 Tax=Ferrovibrio sp. TaxID=1917215 RepID=UPI0025C3151D|nr:serine--tRNA ligase [Ferrovibrio sp.]MBX3454319.1 serine--tRNA ligase [Ferrovibrio sp.]